ncbi:MAG: hypothetical protein AAF288_01360 [Planctomycetota bacterium]
MEWFAHALLAVAIALAMSPSPFVYAAAGTNAPGPSCVANVPAWAMNVPEGVPICGVTVTCCGFCCVTDVPQKDDQRAPAPAPERRSAEPQPNPFGQLLPPGMGNAEASHGPTRPAEFDGAPGVRNAVPDTSGRLARVCRRLT